MKKIYKQKRKKLRVKRLLIVLVFILLILFIIFNKQKPKNTVKEVSSDEIVQVTPSPEPTPKIEEEITKDTFYLKVNTIANVVNIYKKDNNNNNFTIPFKAMICSTGEVTPKSGKHQISDKYRWHALFGDVYGQYCSRITGSILFHSVPYLSESPDSLQYFEYDKLGTSASSGCVRLTVEDTKWIYDNCPKGTYVEFYGDENPGPLGKPTASKISSNEACRGWDPTDVWSEGNPWKTQEISQTQNEA